MFHQVQITVRKLYELAKLTDEEIDAAGFNPWSIRDAYKQSPYVIFLKVELPSAVARHPDPYVRASWSNRELEPYGEVIPAYGDMKEPHIAVRLPGTSAYSVVYLSEIDGELDMSRVPFRPGYPVGVKYPCAVCGKEMGVNFPSGVCSRECLDEGQGFLHSSECEGAYLSVE